MRVFITQKIEKKKGIFCKINANCMMNSKFSLKNEQGRTVRRRGRPNIDL